MRRDRRCCAWPAGRMMNQGGRRAKCNAVGPRLDRGVRPRWRLNVRLGADQRLAQQGPGAGRLRPAARRGPETPRGAGKTNTFGRSPCEGDPRVRPGASRRLRTAARTPRPWIRVWPGPRTGMPRTAPNSWVPESSDSWPRSAMHLKRGLRALPKRASFKARVPRPNVRGEAGPTVGRQARLGENVPRTAKPGLVARRWASPRPRG